MSAPVRIAMWSGPRNLSTAMMRSFEARGDCAVVDEPYYAFYLSETGIDHPMREEILRRGETSAARIEAFLTGDVPGGRPLFYQKHMPHHVVEGGAPLGWLGEMRHVLLIRDPRHVAASFDAKRPAPSARDLGAPQMDEVAARIEALTGAPPPVIEAEDIRADPEGMTRALCAALEIPWTARMLSWPAGRRETDGVWAAHWYGAVERSTGFSPPPGPPPALAPHLAAVADAARPSFEQLRARKLTALREK